MYLKWFKYHRSCVSSHKIVLNIRSSLYYIYCASHKKIISSVSDKKAERTLLASFNAQIRFNPFSLDDATLKATFVYATLESSSLFP